MFLLLYLFQDRKGKLVVRPSEAWLRNQNVNVGTICKRRRGIEKKMRRISRKGDETKKREMWVGGAERLMCPSRGEAGQKLLSMELNRLHYWSSAPESISDITRPSQTGSYNPQRA